MKPQDKQQEFSFESSCCNYLMSSRSIHYVSPSSDVVVVTFGDQEHLWKTMRELYEVLRPIRLLFCTKVHIKKQSRTFLTDQREVNRTKTRKNMFSFVFLCFLLFFQLAHVAHNNTEIKHEEISIHIIAVLGGTNNDSTITQVQVT